MLSKIVGYLIYRAFIFLSKRVSFQDFTHIWNEAYSAHCEAEWTRLKRQSLNIKYMQAISGDLVEVRPKEPLSELILLKRVQGDGRDVN